MTGNRVDFDAIVVGARCAGAALATHLARRGRAVALLDSAPQPSDQPSSTHLIQPPGMDELDMLGIGDQVRELTPALTTVRMRFDHEAADFTYGRGRTAHCLRRSALDGRLQHAAQDAGACLLDEHRVIDVLRDDLGAVNGVEVRPRRGPVRRLTAPLVVGADGRHSSIARLVGAREYHGYDLPRVCYWSYWRRPAGVDPHVVHNQFVGTDQRVAFPTDSDLLLIATAPPIEQAGPFRANHTAAYLDDVQAEPHIAALLDSDRPVSDVRGVVKGRYFFRQAAGPGWALIGDAGHHKDFIVGLGITDALRDARILAEHLHELGSDGTQSYWRTRDRERLPTYLWSQDLGAADPVTALERLVARNVARQPALAPRLGAVFDGDLSPFRLIPPHRAVAWGVTDLLRGRARPIADITTTLRREHAASRVIKRNARRFEADSAPVRA